MGEALLLLGQAFEAEGEEGHPDADARQAACAYVLASDLLPGCKAAREAARRCLGKLGGEKEVG